MRDAYDKLFNKINNNVFFKESVEDIIYVENDSIQSQWENLKFDLLNNKTIYIRGYGRDGKGTMAFIELYKLIFENSSILKDSTNNAQPTKLLKELTNFCKNEKEAKRLNKEYILNYQISHLFGKTKNPLLFNSAWNLAYVPKYLDPFMGHESQGNHSIVFKELMLPQFKSKFKTYIKDYNEFIDKHINPELEYALKIAKKKVETKHQVRFEKEVRVQLSKI